MTVYFNILGRHHGVAFWTKDDSGGDVTEKSEGLEQSHARLGQGKVEDGATGKENYHGHKETCKGWADGT